MRAAAEGDLLGIADGVHYHHGVHVDGLHRGGIVGEGHQTVGDHHHMVGVLGVGPWRSPGSRSRSCRPRPGSCPWGRWWGAATKAMSMCTSPPSMARGPSPMAADDGGGLQLAGGDHLAHLSPDAGGLDADPPYPVQYTPRWGSWAEPRLVAAMVRSFSPSSSMAAAITRLTT